MFPRSLFLLGLLPLAALADDQAGPTARVDAFGDPLPPGAVARVGTTRFRHRGAVVALAWSPDGAELVSASHDRTVCFWDAKTGKLLRRLTGHDGAVFALALSADGKRLATGGEDKTVRVWEAATGKLLWHAGAHKEPVYCLTFSPDGTRLAAGGGDARVRLWDAADGKELRQFIDDADLPGPPAKPPKEGSPQATPVPTSNVYAVAFSPDGKTLAAGGMNKAVRLWDVATGKKTRELATQPPAMIHGLAFAPDGTRLASASVARGGFSHVWDVATGKALVRDAARAAGMAYSGDGKTLVLCPAFDDDYIRLADADTGRDRQTIRHPGAFAVALSPDGQTLASGGSDQLIRLLDVKTGKDRLPALGTALLLSALELSADGKLLAGGSRGGHLTLFDPATGKVVQELPRQADALLALAFDPAGKRLLACDEQSQFRGVDVATGKAAPQPGPLVSQSPHAFSSDGRWLASAVGPRQVVVWDLATGKKVQEFAAGPGEHRSVVALALAPHEPLAVLALHAGEYGTVLELWDWRAGKKVRDFQGLKHTPHRALVFSPDGRSVAAGSALGEVWVWETATGQQRARLGRKQLLVTALAFAPDGRTLAVGLGDWWGPYDVPDERHRFDLRPREACDVSLWDLATAKEKRFPAAHQHTVPQLAFFPDGRRLVSLGWEGTGVIWSVQAPAPLKVGALTAGQLDQLWERLAGPDGGTHKVLWTLVRAPQTVAYFKERLRPVPPADAAAVAEFRKALTSDKFAVRQEAAAELKKRGSAAEPLLRLLLDGDAPLELRLRVEPLLQAIVGPPLPPEQLRMVRAVEVLERLGTGEARALLATLAQGAPGAWLTVQAQGSVQRLDRLQKS
jgi:WD40 repeat protein